MSENKDLTRTYSVANFKRDDDSNHDEKVLKRWDSQSVLRKVSEIGKRTVDTIRHSKKSSVTLRAPKESRSTLRGAGIGTWGGKTAKQAATIVAAAPAPLPARNNETHVFGIPLHVLMARQERQLRQAAGTASEEDKEKSRQLAVPLVVNKMVEHLMMRGVKEEGFFRHASSRDETESVKQKMNSGAQVDFYKISVHTIGDLLKSFVRDIPGSLFESAKMDRWLAIAELESAEQRAQQCKSLLMELEFNNRAMITVLFKLLNQVVLNKGYNKMDEVNVARVFAPNILRHPNADMQDVQESMDNIAKVTTILETFILYHDFIFKELDVQYRLVPTIGTKKAASVRSKDVNKKARSTLRGAPPPPPAAAPQVEDPAPPAPAEVAPVAEPVAPAGKQPALKKQKSEASSAAFVVKKEKEPVANMQRSKTELALEQAAAKK